jgi:hypothetical protein
VRSSAPRAQYVAGQEFTTKTVPFVHGTTYSKGTCILQRLIEPCTSQIQIATYSHNPATSVRFQINFFSLLCPSHLPLHRRLSIPFVVPQYQILPSASLSSQLHHPSFTPKYALTTSGDRSSTLRKARGLCTRQFRTPLCMS